MKPAYPGRRVSAAEAEEIKACCAVSYQQDAVALILGDSYHPGGLELTRHLARCIGLTPGERVLLLSPPR